MGCEVETSTFIALVIGSVLIVVDGCAAFYAAEIGCCPVRQAENMVTRFLPLKVRIDGI
tara:strand:+ start:156 stop:332 length:177 start_codon:yes stop_codon:yes gene_type:complete